MEENLVRIFLENDPHLTLHYYMIKLCLTNSYDVLHILRLMLLFSQIIPHPERMELPQGSYIKLARYEIHARKRGYFSLAV